MRDHVGQADGLVRKDSHDAHKMLNREPCQVQVDLCQFRYFAHVVDAIDKTANLFPGYQFLGDRGLSDSQQSSLCVT